MIAASENDTDNSDQAFQELVRVLEEAVRGSASTITLKERKRKAGE